MLELTHGGRCISGLAAIEFMERLADMFDEDIKTDEFCDEYECALNRFRYEVRKSVPVPPKKGPGRITYYNCGQCGHILDVNDKFCSACGRQVHWDALRSTELVLPETIRPAKEEGDAK